MWRVGRALAIWVRQTLSRFLELDLVRVANGFGTSPPDPNGDGVVNILDLTLVAQQFSQ